MVEEHMMFKKPRPCNMQYVDFVWCIMMYCIYLQTCIGFGRFWLFLHRCCDQAKWRSQGESGPVTVLHSAIGVRITLWYSASVCKGTHTEIVHRETHTPFISSDYSHMSIPNMNQTVFGIRFISSSSLSVHFSPDPTWSGLLVQFWAVKELCHFTGTEQAHGYAMWYRCVYVSCFAMTLWMLLLLTSLQCITAFRVVGFNPIGEDCLAPFSLSKPSKSIQDTFYTSASGSVACVAVVDGAGTWQLSSVQMSRECQDVMERRKEM